MAAPLFLLLALLSSSPVALVSAKDFHVGGDQTWAPGVNYTTWAEKYQFHVGDWLEFYYQKGMYDVVEVNKTAYGNCSADDPIMNYSRGHSFAFELNESRWYYFICSRGYCYSGMRLAVFAEPLASPSASPVRSAASNDGWSPVLSGRRQALWAATVASIGALAFGLRLFW